MTKYQPGDVVLCQVGTRTQVLRLRGKSGATWEADALGLERRAWKAGTRPYHERDFHGLAEGRMDKRQRLALRLADTNS